MPATIDQLIINSPYEEPTRHWSYKRETRTFVLEDGRRPAGYVRASEHSQAFDDPGVLIELPLVNQIRKRVGPWRKGGYPGVTGITKRLLEHWHDPDQRDPAHRLFFCSLEAVEMLIWLTEARRPSGKGSRFRATAATSLACAVRWRLVPARRF